MGIDVGSAVGSINIDTKGVTRAVDTIQRSLGRLSSDSEKSFSRAGKAAEDGFGKVKRSSEDAGRTLDKVGKSMSRFIGPAAFLGLGAAAAAGMGLVVRSAMNMNATLETTELQFETLMGSADKAQKHVKELFTFAERTPFETGPIIEASKMLRTFGGDALDTAANMTLLGDAAAATNAPIDELGFWVGRLYSNLQAGQPFGEAAMRLQELAILSPQARQEMEALQKAGASAAEIFTVFQGDLGKFSGAMEKQAGTWAGLASTITDKVNLMLAEGFEPLFESVKEGMEGMAEWLSSPEVKSAIEGLSGDLEELLDKSKEVFGFIGQGLTAEGMRSSVMRDLGRVGFDGNMEADIEYWRMFDEARKELGIGFFESLAPENDIRINAVLIEQMKELYGLRIEFAKSLEGTKVTWADWAAAELEGQAEARNAMDEAWAAANERLDAAMIARVKSTEEANKGLVLSHSYMRLLGDGSKLAADRTNKFADGLSRLAERAAAVKGSLEAAAAAQESFNAAIVAVEGDYTRKLPGEDKPLVTPERTVSHTTGGLSPEQQQLLADYRGEVKKLEEDLYNLTNGIGTFGMEQEKVNERIADAQGEIAHYRQLMAPLEGVTGQVSTSQQGLAVNVSAVHRAIYEQLLTLPKGGEAAIAFAGATGIMSEAQMKAALIAASVQEKIIALAAEIAKGLPIDAALADLDAYIDRIENGVDPAVADMTTNTPTRIGEMRTRMLEEVEGLGTDIPTNLATGLAETTEAAVTAATDTATAVTDAMRSAFGVESPSTVFMEIGGELTAGLSAGLADTAGDALAVIERIGRDVVGAWDEAIDRMPEVGRSIISGVVAGVEAERGSLIAKMVEIAQEAYRIAMEELKAKSPSRLFMEMGAAIIDGIVAGIEGTEDRLYAKLADVADRLLGIGEGVFGMRGNALKLDVTAADDALRAGLADLQARYLISPEDVERLMAIDPEARIAALQQLRLSPQFMGNASGTGYLNNVIGLAQERNELEAEYIRQQEELKALEEARRKLDFLGYQMELLALISENGLDTSILEGLELGLDANMNDIIAAMTAAVQELIARTEDELEIASPSKVFRDIGANIMRGMALGIADHKPLATVLKERLLDAQQLGLTLNPEQTVYIFGGYNPQMGQRGTPRDALRDLYYQGL